VKKKGKAYFMAKEFTATNARKMAVVVGLLA